MRMAMTGGSPVRVFGIDDNITDMMFNTVGAVLVSIWKGIADGKTNSPFFTASPEATINGRPSTGERLPANNTLD